MTDAAHTDFVAKTPPDWDGSAQPGEVDDALDQLAQRVRAVQPGTFDDNDLVRADGNDGLQGSGITVSDDDSVTGVNIISAVGFAFGAGTISGNVNIGGTLGGGGNPLEISDNLDFQSSKSILNLTTGSGAAIRTALGFEFARKASDETINSSTTMQNDDDLVLAFAANETALVTMAATLQTTAAADVKIGFTFPTGGTLHLVGTIGRGNNSNFSGNVYLSSSGEEQSFPMTGFKSVLHLTGIYRNGGTSGNLQFQWAQNTSDAGDTKFFADSALWKMRYA